MKFIRNNIPNAITALNLFLGLLGIYFAFKQQLVYASFCVVGAAVADFFDGMAARLLKSDTKIGKDLDSLADVVSFGVAPVFVYVNLYISYEAFKGNIIPGFWTTMIEERADDYWVILPVFLIAIFSAVRLAIFNNDTRQTTSFIGLPTPANGLLIISFVLIAYFQPHFFPVWLVEPWFIITFSLLSSFLLVSPIPLFALKFKQWGFKGNEVRYLFLLTSVVLLAVLHFVAIPLIIILYILLSLILNFAKK